MALGSDAKCCSCWDGNSLWANCVKAPHRLPTSTPQFSVFVQAAQPKSHCQDICSCHALPIKMTLRRSRYVLRFGILKTEPVRCAGNPRLRYSVPRSRAGRLVWQAGADRARCSRTLWRDLSKEESEMCLHILHDRISNSINKRPYINIRQWTEVSVCMPLRGHMGRKPRVRPAGSSMEYWFGV